MHRKPSRRAEAFTLVEALIAASVGAVLITAALIGFGAISISSMRGGRVDVQLPSGTHQALYGQAQGDDSATSDLVTMLPNPNYFQAAQARRLKSRLLEDVDAASAVFCLGREGLGGVRAAAIPIVNLPVDFREVATPQAFRDFLAAQGADPAQTFEENQPARLLNSNATLFIVGGLTSSDLTDNFLQIIAVYEVDFVSGTEPAGVYASVRRFGPDDQQIPTDFYHVFYPDEDNGDGGFRPLAVFFGRSGASGIYARAANFPFTMMWWPDPLVSRLAGQSVPAEPMEPESPRLGYANMAGRTSLFTVLPTFPSL